jgi:hypothetical protein
LPALILFITLGYGCYDGPDYITKYNDKVYFNTPTVTVTQQQLESWIEISLAKWAEIKPEWKECAYDGIHGITVTFENEFPLRVLTDDGYWNASGASSFSITWGREIYMANCAKDPERQCQFQDRVFIHELGHHVVNKCDGTWGNSLHHQFFKDIGYGY